MSNASLSHKPMSINTAGMEELASLPRIGDKKAAELLEYRSNLGFFLTAEDFILPTSPLSGKDVAIAYAYFSFTKPSDNH